MGAEATPFQVVAENKGPLMKFAATIWDDLTEQHPDLELDSIETMVVSEIARRLDEAIKLPEPLETYDGPFLAAVGHLVVIGLKRLASHARRRDRRKMFERLGGRADKVAQKHVEMVLAQLEKMQQETPAVKPAKPTQKRRPRRKTTARRARKK